MINDSNELGQIYIISDLHYSLDIHLKIILSFFKTCGYTFIYTHI